MMRVTGELTGHRRHTRVMPWTVQTMPHAVMALEVEYSEYNYERKRWENKWRWATPEDVANDHLPHQRG